MGAHLRLGWNPAVRQVPWRGATECKFFGRTVSDAPGLGTDVNEELAKKYPYKRAYLPTARRKDGSVQDW